MKLAHDRHGVGLHSKSRQDQRHAGQAPYEATKRERLRPGAGVKAVEGEETELQENEAEHGEVVGARPRRRHEGRAREGDPTRRLENVEGKEGPHEREEGEEEDGEA